MIDPEFEALLHRARAGDEDALCKLVDPLSAVLRRQARKRLSHQLEGKVEDADVVQDALLSFFRRGYFNRPFETVEDLIALLCSMIDHKAHKLNRRYLDTAKRRAGREVPLTTFALGKPADGEVSIEEQSAVEDLWEHVLAGQPPIRQAALRRWRAGEPVPAIAEELGLAERTLSRVIRQVLGNLRKMSGGA